MPLISVGGKKLKSVRLLVKVRLQARDYVLAICTKKKKKKNSCIYLEGFTIKVPDIETTDSAETLNKTRSAPFNGISEACRDRARSKDERDAPVKVQTDVITDASSCPFASSTVI